MFEKNVFFHFFVKNFDNLRKVQHSLKFPIGNLVPKSAAPILKIAALIQIWAFFGAL